MVILNSDDDGSFSNFPIDQRIIDRLRERNIDKLFPVQYKTFDSIIEGKDVVVLARTGTGKTLAFSLPLIQNLFNVQINHTMPLILVLAPTRELVVQITEDFNSICRDDFTVLSLYGGVPYNIQCNALRRGVHIVVGTPGRVNDLLEKEVLKLTKVAHVVLDEVDRMLDMGFSKDVEKILKLMFNTSNKSNPQMLLFSATMPAWVKTISRNYLRKDAFQLSLIDEKEAKTSKSVEHLAILCPYEGRASTISDVIRVYCKTRQSRCIVFCDRKKDADELASHSAMSADCHVFHGDIPQDKRELVLQKFRDGKYRTLITTNVASRGLDIPSVDLVVQLHPPKDIEDYIHRSGRTGRADRSGVCICFYTNKERSQLMEVERRAGITFKRISPPTVQDITAVWGREIINSFKSIPNSSWTNFVPMAQSIIESFSSERETEDSADGYEDEDSNETCKKKSKSKSALRALCCALAQLSGKDGTIVARSALSAQQGLTAYKLDINYDVERKGFAYSALRRNLPEEIVDSLKNLSFIKGKKGFVFDFPSEHDELVQSTWPEDSQIKLSLLTEIPELEPEAGDFSMGRGRSFGDNRWGGNGGGFGGGGGRGGYGRRDSYGHSGSMKRPYQNAKDHMQGFSKPSKWKKLE